MNSIQLIFSLINSMIGETALALPVIMNKEGYVSCLLVLLLQGFIAFKTCGILVGNLKAKERDVGDTIQRLLGIRWWKFFTILSCVYLYLVSLQYFLLINNMIYRMITFFMAVSGNTNFVHASHFSYSQFSPQILTLFTAIPIGVLTFIRKMGVLVKISEYGIFSIFAYLVFIFFLFLVNVIQGNVSEHAAESAPAWTFDLGNISGASAIGFSVHTTIGPIIKQSAHPEMNQRNLSYAFTAVFLIYSFIGVFGGLGLVGRTLYSDTAENINDFFSQTDASLLVIQMLYFVNLATCLPLYFNISRTRLFEFFFSDRDAPQSWHVTFNLSYVCVCVALSNMPFIKSADLMNANGAITCFFTMYLIPIILHFQAYHGQDSLMLKLKKSISRIGVIDDSEIALETTLLLGVKMEKEDKHNIFLNYEEDNVDLETDDQQNQHSLNGCSSSESKDERTVSSYSSPASSRAGSSVVVASASYNSKIIPAKKQLREKKEFEQRKQLLLENKSFQFSVIFYGVIGIVGLVSLIFGIIKLSQKFFSSEPDVIIDN